jgi:hypothetical protein
MSNDYYTNTSTATDGTVADAADVNPQFTSIEAAFDAMQALTKRALKVPAAETSDQVLPAAAARINKALMFDGSGNPVIEAKWRQNWDANGFTLINLPTPVALTDPVTLGYLNNYSASLAGVPSFAGQSGKLLGTNGSTVYWTTFYPSVTGKAGYVLTTDGSTAFWGAGALISPNLLPNPTGQLANKFFTGSSATASRHATTGAYEWSLGAATHENDANVCLIGAGQAYRATVEVETTNAGGTITFNAKFYDSGNSLLGTGTTTGTASISGGQRLAISGTTPASTAYAKLGIVNSAGTVRLRRFKLEVDLYSGPTAFSDEATLPAIWQEFQAQSKFGDTVTGAVTVEVGGANATQANIDLHSKGSGTSASYDARIETTGGTANVDGKGIVRVLGAAFKTSGAIGYDASFPLNNLGATPSIDWANGAHQNGTLNLNATITLASPPAGYPLGTYRVYLTDTAGSHTMAWAGTTVTWAGGVAPPAQAAGAVIAIYLDWNGTKYLGQWTAF